MAKIYECQYKKNVDSVMSTERKKIQADDMSQAINAIYDAGISDDDIVYMNVIAGNDDIIIANIDTIVTKYNNSKVNVIN